MAEKAKEYKSTDELKALFKNFDSSDSRRKDFIRDLDQLWNHSGAQALCKHTDVAARKWATGPGKYAKLKFMCVTLSEKPYILDLKRLLENYGFSIEQIIDAGFDDGDYIELFKRMAQHTPK